MSKLSNQEKENKQFQKLSVWVLFILFIAFTAAGLVRIFVTGDSVDINGTKLHLQVKSGWQYLIFGLLFLIACFINLRNNKKNRVAERTSEESLDRTQDKLHKR